MSSASDNAERKVCFICGSYTNLILNIYEKRSGPNIVDVINEKFKVLPLNENKFVCYSCNNWLINWHSLQNKPDNSNKSSKNLPNSSKSIPEEEEETTMVILTEHEQYLEALNLREKLQKYFYTRRGKHPESREKKVRETKLRFLKCNLCGVSLKRRHLCITTRNMFVNNKCLRFCRQCKCSLRRYFSAYQKCERNLQHETHLLSTGNKSSPKKLVNPYVVSRLRKLGTTVVCEGSSEACKPLPFQQFHSDRNERRSSCGTNEIVLSFNTTLTEVFPLDLTKKEMLMDETIANKLNFNELIQQIPPSLTVSLA